MHTLGNAQSRLGWVPPFGSKYQLKDFPVFADLVWVGQVQHSMESQAVSLIIP